MTMRPLTKRFFFPITSTRRSTRQPWKQAVISRLCQEQRWMHAGSSNKVVTAPDAVTIVEVGPRDGLQNEPTILSTDTKIEFIKRLHQAGCNHIEAGSFVSPKWVPSMADSFQVMQGLDEWRQTTTCLSKTSDNNNNNLILSCLVPNLKGLELARQVHADEIAIFASASEAFSQANINCSIDESMERFRQVVSEANKDENVAIRGYVSCVIACPYQGQVAPSQVARVVEQLLTLGCRQVSLGDTIGVGTPATTIRMLQAVQAAVGGNNNDNDDSLLAVHFHDTYGQALANILVSLERGISTVDASVSGLGGCPYAKGASGNVATEDVVYMLNGLGVETGIDLDKLVDAGEYICSALKQKSRSRAGTAIAAKRQSQETAS